MNGVPIIIPTDRIVDRSSFHEVFAEVLGFPAYYGHNMDAWIDCMTFVDDADAMMTTRAVGLGELMILQMNDAADFAKRCPAEYHALVECTAFVNYRRVKEGQPPVLALLMCGDF